MAAANLYLPDECWECVFRFVKNGYDDRRNRDLKSLLVVSKQFLSITNRLRFSISIYDPSSHCLSRLFQRFPNLASLKLWFHCSAFCWISSLLYNKMKYLQMNSIYLTSNPLLRDESIQMLASIFPNLQLLDLSHCNISEEGIFQVLRRYSNIRHLNLTNCSRVKLHEMNFEVPKLEVLNLSRTTVDDETLHVISKSCRGLLHLILDYCFDVTEKGVRHVVENCTQLREINLRRCVKVVNDVLVSLILSRPSLRLIIAPYYELFSKRDIELLSRQGCIIW